MLLFGSGMIIPVFARYRFYSFWALLGLLPAAVVSFTDIAWTPWAERYLYFSLVPLSFISSIFCVQLIHSHQGFPRRVMVICAASVVIVFAFFSVQRAHVWNNALALSHDTYKKSPYFIPAVVEYARSLHEKGMREEAEQQLHKAASLSGPKHQVLYCLGGMSLERGNHERARQYYLQALAEARVDKKLVLMGPHLKKNILSSLSDVEMVKSKSPSNDKKTKHRYYQKAIGYLLEAHNEDPSDSFLLYNIAKLYLITGNKTEAVKYFEEFIEKRDNDIYRQTAEKLLKKIRSSAMLLSHV
jgi:tetratricopeptide (TPR) repeat protein